MMPLTLPLAIIGIVKQWHSIPRMWSCKGSLLVCNWSAIIFLETTFCNFQITMHILWGNASAVSCANRHVSEVGLMQNSDHFVYCLFLLYITYEYFINAGRGGIIKYFSLFDCTVFCSAVIRLLWKLLFCIGPLPALFLIQCNGSDQTFCWLGHFRVQLTAAFGKIYKFALYNMACLY